MNEQKKILFYEEGFFEKSIHEYDPILSSYLDKEKKRQQNQKSEKIKSAEEDFQKVLDTNISSSNLFEMMQMPKNRPLEFSEAFTKENHGREFPYRFIETDIYGTRSTTTVIINEQNIAEIQETCFTKGNETAESKKFKIEIK